MEFLDNFELQYDFLSEEYGLLRPNLDHSVAGILPAVLSHWNEEIPLQDKQLHRHVFERLLESYPGGYDNIILLIADGIGVQDLSSIGGELWENITTRGTIASSTFPSMTSTAMTSLIYGTFPGTHGIVGYNIYNEQLKHVWNSLRMRFVDNDQHIREILSVLQLADLVYGPSLTQLIQERIGNEILFLTPDFLKPPGLGHILNPTLKRRTYTTYKMARDMILKKLNASSKPKFIALYLPEPDTAGHTYGPNAIQYQTSIRNIESFIAELREYSGIDTENTLVVVTSDHGLSGISRWESNWMGKTMWEGMRQAGTLLSSSGRTIHGYSLDQNPEQVRDVLLQMADNQGLVIDGQTAHKLAGGGVSRTNHIGDYVLLCAEEYLHAVPDCLSGDINRDLRGQHGSLSSRELFVPVVIY